MVFRPGAQRLPFIVPKVGVGSAGSSDEIVITQLEAVNLGGAALQIEAHLVTYIPAEIGAQWTAEELERSGMMSQSNVPACRSTGPSK